MTIKTKEILRQVSSSTKINILCWILMYEKLTVSKLVELTKIKRTNISKQINEMKNSDLLNIEKKGRFNYYFLTDNLHPEQLKMIKALVNSFHFIDEEKLNHKFY